LKRKRKNAEINPLREAEQPVDDRKKKGTRCGTDYPLDLRPRWRRVYTQDHHVEGRNDFVKKPTLFPIDTCRPLQKFIINDETEDSSDCQCHKDNSLKTPTFRLHATSDPEKDRKSDDSPACVFSGPNGQDSLYIWQRSLAWSDDDWSDDEGDHVSRDRHESEVRRYSTFFSPPLVSRDSSSQLTPIAHKTFAYNDRQLNDHSSFSQHEVIPVDELRSPDSFTSEIFWEEKVLDTSDLERMAKLSI